MSTVIFTFQHKTVISLAHQGKKIICQHTISKESARLFRLCISRKNNKDQGRAKRHALKGPGTRLANPSIHSNLSMGKVTYCVMFLKKRRIKASIGCRRNTVWHSLFNLYSLLTIHKVGTLSRIC